MHGIPVQRAFLPASIPPPLRHAGRRRPAGRRASGAGGTVRAGRAEGAAQSPACEWHEKPRLPPGALPEGSRGCRHMRLPCLQKAPSRSAPRKAEPAP